MNASAKISGGEETPAPSLREIRDALLAQVYADVKAGRLQGTALSQAMASMARILASEPSNDVGMGGAPAALEPTVGEVIAGIGNLPVARKIEILEQSRVRIVDELARELDAIDAVLPGLREQLAAEVRAGAGEAFAVVTDVGAPLPDAVEGAS